MNTRWIFLAVLMILILSGESNAKVTRIEITHRQTIADDQSFGDVGLYEQISGKVFFAVDPQAEANQQVIDLNPLRIMRRDWSSFPQIFS